jgi:serine/threonine protein kinase/tetratricopeptide (TPR) repeat protein
MVPPVISHYSVLQKLGQGGMGEVYLAEDTSLRRKVALKLLPAGTAADDAARKRLVKEARAAAALDHPNICSIYEVGEEDGRSFIAMQYVEGETLAARMLSQPLQIREVLDIAAQTGDALAEAHSRGVIHRDIKPANVMITSRRQVKVMDFGLARTVGHDELVESHARTESLLSEPGMIVGTLPYMSPEQVSGQPVDARSDIFSFGAMLYEMVTGQKPFAGDNAAATLSAILTRDPPPLARYSRDVPAELERIVTKAMRKDPEERYQLIREMALDLRNLREKVDFETKLESSGPASLTRAAGAESGPSPVGAARASEVGSARSDRSLIAGLKQHQRGAVLALAAIVVAGAAVTYFNRNRAGSDSATITSMAILPFANVSADPDTEYLSEGITESLTNSLSQLPNLRMIARSSALRYKGRETDPQTAARELGVQAVLTGRVVRRGDSLSVSAELVDARDNSHLWGEQYNRRLSDILAVQQEIAADIAGKLRARLTGEQRRRVTRSYTENVEAYQLYLRGRHHWSKRTHAGLTQAIDYFRQAIDRDPNYALAYSGLADSYVNLSGYTNVLSDESLPLARAAALRALELDGSLAEGHASLGTVHNQSWNWAEAERELKRAIELNPNYASAHHWYGLWLEFMGRDDEALAEYRRAQEIDPLAPIIYTNVARQYLKRGDLDAGFKEARKAIELNPDFPSAHLVLGLLHLKQGGHDEALEEFRKVRELSGSGSSWTVLGYGYALAGRRAEAIAVLKAAEERYERRETAGASLAMVHAGLGNKDEAFAWLEKDFQIRSATLANALLLFPYFDSLRDDPRYADLLRRMGLPVVIRSSEDHP